MTRQTFEQAVYATPPITFYQGLQALSRVDRSHVYVEETERISGSACLDDAYRVSQPNAPVWDYGVAYRKSQETIYWMEIHPADNRHIEDIVKKATWLLYWLNREGSHFLPFPRIIAWVATGSSALSAKDPKRRRLEKAGVQFVGKRLHIP